MSSKVEVELAALKPSYVSPCHYRNPTLHSQVEKVLLDRHWRTAKQQVANLIQQKTIQRETCSQGASTTTSNFTCQNAWTASVSRQRFPHGLHCSIVQRQLNTRDEWSTVPL